MTDIPTDAPLEQPPAPAGATVQTVENPDNDPVTVAQSKVDVMHGFVLDHATEVAQTEAKVAAVTAELAGAQQALDELNAEADGRNRNLADAQAELDAAIAANPVLAEAHHARREANITNRRADLQAQLDRLTAQEG